MKIIQQLSSVISDSGWPVMELESVVIVAAATPVVMMAVGTSSQTRMTKM